MPTVEAVCIADADETQTGAGFDSTRNYTDMLEHYGAANARTVAFRYQVPDTVVIADITNVVISGYGVLTNTVSGDYTVEANAGTLATNLTTRWTAAAAQNGSTGLVNTTSTNNVVTNSPALTTQLKNALTNSTASGGYYTVAVIWKSRVGTTAVQARWASVDHTTYAETKLVITVAAPANFDATLPVINPTTTVDALLQDEDVGFTGVSALGTGSGAEAYRKLDMYVPRTGTKPSGGWPVVVFVHGGRWVTGDKGISSSENYIQRSFIEKFTDSGYAVASTNYRSCQENLNPAAIYHSFPRNVHDVYAAMEYLHVHASDYDIDSSKMVLTGHSAGGHIAAFAALACATGDSTTYNGSQASSGNRPAGYGYSSSASPWQFDLDEYGELSAPAPAGIMLWDAPIDVYAITTIGGLAGTANANARKALMGEALGSAVYDTEDEADLNHYIDGTGNVYTTAKDKADIPPIFFLYGTNEDLVLNSASIGALETALDNIGYDTSTGVGTLNTLGGLTKHSVARNHADVLRDQAPDFTEGIAWMAEVTADNPLPIFIGTGQADTIYVGSTAIDAIHMGSTKIWP